MRRLACRTAEQLGRWGLKCRTTIQFNCRHGLQKKRPAQQYNSCTAESLWSTLKIVFKTVLETKKGFSNDVEQEYNSTRGLE
jgi:hypothetical protein